MAALCDGHKRYKKAGIKTHVVRDLNQLPTATFSTPTKQTVKGEAVYYTSARDKPLKENHPQQTEADSKVQIHPV